MARKVILLGLVMSALSLALANVATAQAPAAKDPPLVPGEGRLHNLTSRPFTFQLHRVDGAKWTDGYVIQPGKYYSVRVPRPGTRSEIMGITGNGEGFVIVRYREPKFNGFMTLRLSAVNPASLKREPTWFVVEDANGLLRLIQEGSVEAAQATQESILKQPPLSPTELEQMQKTLRNNWVLTN